MHLQTQGKIERWDQTLKNRILLENDFLPSDPEAQVEAFVEHYNHQCDHESLNNVTRADAYFGRATRKRHAVRARARGRSSGSDRQNANPSHTSAAALRRCSGVIRLSRPSWSSGPKSPQFEPSARTVQRSVI
jgi:Integrase core domain